MPYVHSMYSCFQGGLNRSHPILTLPLHIYHSDCHVNFIAGILIFRVYFSSFLPRLSSQFLFIFVIFYISSLMQLSETLHVSLQCFFVSVFWF